MELFSIRIQRTFQLVSSHIFAAYTRIWNNPVFPIALQTSFGDIQSQTDLLGIQSLFHFNRTNFLFNGFNLGG